MIINDVIREAKSEHEVYFLLTAYVEAVRYCDRLSFLPAQVRDLPLNGVDDVRTRIVGLQAALGRSSARETDGRSRAIVQETADVLGDALNRLQWLEGEKRRDHAMRA
jgi:hypothetical protein